MIINQNRRRILEDLKPLTDKVKKQRLSDRHNKKNQKQLPTPFYFYQTYLCTFQAINWQMKLKNKKYLTDFIKKRNKNLYIWDRRKLQEKIQKLTEKNILDRKFFTT